MEKASDGREKAFTRRGVAHAGGSWNAGLWIQGFNNEPIQLCLRQANERAVAMEYRTPGSLACLVLGTITWNGDWRSGSAVTRPPLTDYFLTRQPSSYFCNSVDCSTTSGYLSGSTCL